MTIVLVNLSMLMASTLLVYFIRQKAEWQPEDRLARLSLQASLVILLTSNLLICALLLRLEHYAVLPGLLVLLGSVIYAGLMTSGRGRTEP